MQETPRLSVLRLRDVFPPSMTSMILGNITRLTLVQLRVPLPKLEQMLMATAGRLSALSLDTIDLGQTSIDDMTTPLSLPHLRRLVLKDVQPFDLFMLRFSSRAPNLLVLEIGATFPNTIHESLSQAVHSSVVFPALKKLHLICLGDNGPIPLFEPTLLDFFPVLEHVIIREGKASLFALACLQAIRYSLLHTNGVTSGSLPPLRNIWISEPGNKGLFEVLKQIIRRKAKLGCPFEEAVILREPRRVLEDNDASEEGEGENELCEEKEISSISRYGVDEWYREDSTRFLEWEVFPSCPALPFWMRGDLEA